MIAQYVITEITGDMLEKSKALQLIGDVFEEFVAYRFDAEGVNEFRNYIEYDSIKRMLDNSEMIMSGCFHYDKIIGVIAVKPPGRISLLFVDKRYHRQGVADALYRKIVEHCSKNDACSEITVHSSLYAVEAYKRLGFETTDTEQEQKGIRFVPMKHEFRRHF